MKLPEDKKERAKIFILLGIGAAIVLYVTVFGVLRPLLRSRKDKIAGIEELTTKLETGQAKINQMNRGRARNTETLTAILTLANDKKYVLRPRLGNYLLSAREVVEQHAKRAEIEVEVREIGISQLPQTTSGDDEKRALNVYTATVTAQCGLHDLIRLLESIEKANPYLCVSGLSITGQSKSPAAHGVSFQLQWPVWADPAQLQTIEANLKDLTPHAPNEGGKANGEEKTESEEPETFS